MRKRPFTFWRVRPLVGEAANSYFSRLVADECSYLPAAYASEIGLRSIFDPDEPVASISSLPIADEDKTRLRHWTPVERGRRILLAGQEFTAEEFRWERRLGCPHCIRQTPYQRVWWHLACFQTCPVHRQPLQLLEYEMHSVGRWFPRFEAVVKERLPDVEPGDAGPTFESYVIRNMLHRNPAKGARHLAHLAGACEFLGRLLGNPVRHVVPPHTRDDLVRGYEVLQVGRKAVMRHVREWLAQNRPAFPAYKPSHLLGWASGHLELLEDTRDPLREPEPNRLLREVADLVLLECRSLLESMRQAER